MTIGSLISEALTKNDWSLSEMARRVGTGRGQLWGWKNDDFLPTKPNLKKLAKVLRRPYGELVELVQAATAARYR